MSSNGPMFWLLDFEGYDFDIGVLHGTDLRGKILILSRQLWSVVRGSEVVSLLIGPGVFKGVATSRGRRVDVLKRLSVLMFNPSDLRLDEPLPLVDIIGPEVIDPLGSKRVEEIMTVIREMVVERGNVLAEQPLVTVKHEASPPKTAYYHEMVQKIHVSHVSGVQRAKFLLAGTNAPLYRPLIDWYKKRKYVRADNSYIMATHLARFSGFDDEEVVGHWIIVEKAGTTDTTGPDTLAEEYDITYDSIAANEDAYVYE